MRIVALQTRVVVLQTRIIALQMRIVVLQTRSGPVRIPSKQVGRVGRTAYSEYSEYPQHRAGRRVRTSSCERARLVSRGPSVSTSCEY